MNGAVFFCGGTGQLLAYRYLQLYLLGLNQKAVDEELFILDTDTLDPFLQHTLDFIRTLYTSGSDNESIVGSLPRIKFIPLKISELVSTVGENLTGTSEWVYNIRHPVHAFFTNDLLNQDITSGLYARPAIGKIFFNNYFSDPKNQEKFQPSFAQGNIVVTGSIIGGTGGGIIPLLLTRLNEMQIRQQRQWRLRGVFFGEYFKADEQKIEGGQDRIKSNEIFTLKALLEGIPQLHRYYFFRADRLIDRQTHREKNDEPLPWPENESDPFWNGINILRVLMDDTTTDVVDDVFDREFETDRISFNLKQCREYHQEALKRLHIIIRKQVMTRIRKDMFASHIWGKFIVELCKKYYKLACEKVPNLNAKKFMSDLQERLKIVYHNKILKIFPSVSPEIIPPSLIFPTTIAIPSLSPQNYSSYERILEEAAHFIIFTVLQRRT